MKVLWLEEQLIDEIPEWLVDRGRRSQWLPLYKKIEEMELGEKRMYRWADAKTAKRAREAAYKYAHAHNGGTYRLKVYLDSEKCQTYFEKGYPASDKAA